MPTTTSFYWTSARPITVAPHITSLGRNFTPIERASVIV